MTLAACSDKPKSVETKKEGEKPAEPVTGRYAFQLVYPAARAWAADCEPMRIRSLQLSQVKAEPGKAGAWEVLFISPSRGRARTYTYSVMEAEGNLHKGVFGGLEESYSASGQEKPFLVAALKIDSTDAYETAAKQRTEYVKKASTQPVNFLLELTPRFPDPAWRVYWGESVGTAEYSVFIDASTGQYLGR